MRAEPTARAILISAAALSIACRIPIAVPAQERLGPLDDSSIDYALTVRLDPPYQLVLGVPRNAAEARPFDGVLVVSQGPKTVGAFKVSKDNSQTCNWLHDRPDLDGYILTWNSNEPGRSFQQVIAPGGRYKFTFSFEVPPPKGSLVWFSSMDKGFDHSRGGA